MSGRLLREHPELVALVANVLRQARGAGPWSTANLPGQDVEPAYRVVDAIDRYLAASQPSQPSDAASLDVASLHREWLRHWQDTRIKLSPEGLRETYALIRWIWSRATGVATNGELIAGVHRLGQPESVRIGLGDSTPGHASRDNEEETPAPLFGCACENPLSVDTVCLSCIAYLEEQTRASNPESGSR